MFSCFIHLTTNALASGRLRFIVSYFLTRLHLSSLKFDGHLPLLGGRVPVKGWHPSWSAGASKQQHAPTPGEQLSQKFAIIQETQLCLLSVSFSLFLLPLAVEQRIGSCEGVPSVAIPSPGCHRHLLVEFCTFSSWSVFFLPCFSTLVD